MQRDNSAITASLNWEHLRKLRNSRARVFVALDTPPVFWARAIEEWWETRCLPWKGLRERVLTDSAGLLPSVTLQVLMSLEYRHHSGLRARPSLVKAGSITSPGLPTALDSAQFFL